MDENTLADLKQFISATVRQETAVLSEKIDALDVKIDGVEARLDAKIDGVEARLDAKIDDLAELMAQGFDNLESVLQPQLDDHEKRLIKLESKPA